MKGSLAMLLKTNGEKMSDHRPLAMLLKIHVLQRVSRDVDENEWLKEGVRYQVPGVRDRPV
jgi:hypothetical protein